MKNLLLLFCLLLSIASAHAQGSLELKANVLPVVILSRAELSGEYLLSSRIGIEAGAGYGGFLTTIRRPTAVATIGGSQGLELEVINFKHNCNTNVITCTFNLTIVDIFGAGISDGIRSIPGLSEMYALQHYKNFDCANPDPDNTCYRPLIHKIKISHTFTFNF